MRGVGQVCFAPNASFLLKARSQNRSSRVKPIGLIFFRGGATESSDAAQEPKTRMTLPAPHTLDLLLRSCRVLDRKTTRRVRPTPRLGSRLRIGRSPAL